ncbi:uncharacterized protein LTR77_002556 [Saxophila tyrrhenica]|uniref:Ubiquitin-like protease family profile domain-containing protein n=1 Tax=Saxophila tyrrhenica TaxID=1690608 RepID=A0AAV9PM08_9PEZI|nr:hypothetical protein LTR77_002556 [Saxophila tyrrhenica]
MAPSNPPRHWWYEPQDPEETTGDTDAGNGVDASPREESFWSRWRQETPEQPDSVAVEETYVDRYRPDLSPAVTTSSIYWPLEESNEGAAATAGDDGSSAGLGLREDAISISSDGSSSQESTPEPITPAADGPVRRDVEAYFICTECLHPRDVMFRDPDHGDTCGYCVDQCTGEDMSVEQKWCAVGCHSTLRTHFLYGCEEAEDACIQHGPEEDVQAGTLHISEGWLAHAEDRRRNGRNASVIIRGLTRFYLKQHVVTAEARWNESLLSDEDIPHRTIDYESDCCNSRLLVGTSKRKLIDTAFSEQQGGTTKRRTVSQQPETTVCTGKVDQEEAANLDIPVEEDDDDIEGGVGLGVSKDEGDEKESFAGEESGDEECIIVSARSTGQADGSTGFSNGEGAPIASPAPEKDSDQESSVGGDEESDHEDGFGGNFEYDDSYFQFADEEPGEPPQTETEEDKQKKKDQYLAEMIALADKQEHTVAMLRRLFTQRKESGSSPFAAPLLEILELAVSRTVPQQAVTDGEVWREYPLRTRCPLPQEFEIEAISAEEALGVHPPDKSLPDSLSDGWATDNLLEVFAAASNQVFEEEGLKSYIAPILETQYFVPRVDFEEINIVENLKQYLKATENAWAAPNRQEYLNFFPAANMPVATEQLMFLYNVAGNHWVTVHMHVNEERTDGKIEVLDPRWNRSRGKRAFNEMSAEVKVLAQLVSRRDHLHWQNVVWREPQQIRCLTQHNDSDCGFFAWYMATLLARSKDVAAIPDEKKDDEALSMRLRYEGLQLVYRSVIGTELSFEPLQRYLDTRTRSSQRPPSKKGPAKGTVVNQKVSQKGSQMDGGGAPTARRRKGQLESGLDGGTPNTSAAMVQDSSAVDAEESTTDVATIWKIDMRQLLCNVMLTEPAHQWTLDELTEHVSDKCERLAEEHDSELDFGEPEIRMRIRNVLDISEATFQPLRSTDDTVSSFLLRQGPGRLVDSETQMSLLAPPRTREPIFDRLFDHNPGLCISIVRNSAPAWEAEDFRDMEDRAEEQVDLFWALFQSNHGDLFVENDAKPQKVTEWSEMLLDGEPQPAWADYVYCASSAEVLFSLDLRHGRLRAETVRIKTLLQNADVWASEQETRFEVCLLQSNVDGSSTNNDTWKMLCDEYRNLDVHVVMVAETKRQWHPDMFAQDAAINVGWATFDARALATLWSEPACYPMQDEMHIRFLMACMFASYFKLDHAVMSKANAQLQNAIAACRLTGPGRKTFDLSLDEARKCMVCLGEGIEPEEMESLLRCSAPQRESNELLFRCSFHAHIGAFPLLGNSAQTTDDSVLLPPGGSLTDRSPILVSPWLFSQAPTPGRLFRCCYCGFQSDTARQHKVHLKREHNNIVGCPHCPETRPTRHGIVNHTRTAHPGLPTDVCFICGVVYKTAVHHFRQNHPLRLCPVDECLFSSMDPDELAAHGVQRHGIQAMQDAKDGRGCLHTTTKSALGREEDILQCPYCPLTADGAHVMNAHVNRDHPDREQAICFFCGEICKDILNRQYHVRRKHPYSNCTERDCKFKTRTPQQMVLHREDKHGDA